MSLLGKTGLLDVAELVGVVLLTACHVEYVAMCLPFGSKLLILFNIAAVLLVPISNQSAA